MDGVRKDWRKRRPGVREVRHEHTREVQRDLSAEDRAAIAQLKMQVEQLIVAYHALQADVHQLSMMLAHHKHETERIVA